MRIQSKATATVIDERRTRNPAQLLRQLVYRMFNRTQTVVNNNEAMSSSRLRSFIGSCGS